MTASTVMPGLGYLLSKFVVDRKKIAYDVLRITGPGLAGTKQNEELCNNTFVSSGESLLVSRGTCTPSIQARFTCMCATYLRATVDDLNGNGRHEVQAAGQALADTASTVEGHIEGP